MSKAILIMDMPEYCCQCPVCSNGMVCQATGCEVSGERFFNPCPLRALPEPMTGVMIGAYAIGRADGYNECLKEIVGGDK